MNIQNFLNKLTECIDLLIIDIHTNEELFSGNSWDVPFWAIEREIEAITITKDYVEIGIQN